MSKYKQTPLPRSLNEMVEALRRQMRILSDHMQRVYIEGNSDYVPEVAAQLRLLATNFRTNKPLLVELMNLTGINVKVFLQDKPIGLYPKGYDKSKGLTLAEYMKLHTFTTRVSNGDLVEVNNEELVRFLAEKLGGAHEDWDLPEHLAILITDLIFVNGIQMGVLILRGIAETVQRVGNHFILEYDKRTNNSKNRS